jgi:hypothetical protein
MAHRSKIRHVFIDVADADHDRELAFWAGVSDGRPQQWLPDHPEFHTLAPGGQERSAQVFVHVQRLGADATRLHLDIETDDVDAEVARLERLGAERLDRLPHWQVMRSPAGLRFCVVTGSRADLDAAGAVVWET